MKNFSIDKLSLLVFLIWALFLSVEYMGDGATSYVKIHDAGDSVLASRLAIKSDLETHENGNWNPNLLLGLDRMAQDEGLGPIDLLFLFFPGWLAYGLLIFV